MKLILTLLVAMLAPSSAVAQTTLHRTSSQSQKPIRLRGHIIASRFGDSFEVVSFVQNRTAFLFQTTGTPRRIVQIEYPHFGYSTLPNDITRSPHASVFLLRRTSHCDGTFASFKASAPDIPIVDEQTKQQLDITPGLVWNGPALNIGPDTKIPCYTLLTDASNSQRTLSRPIATSQKPASETHP